MLGAIVGDIVVVEAIIAVAPARIGDVYAGVANVIEVVTADIVGVVGYTCDYLINCLTSSILGVIGVNRDVANGDCNNVS